jgi:hypothetical protein
METWTQWNIWTGSLLFFNLCSIFSNLFQNLSQPPSPNPSSSPSFNQTLHQRKQNTTHAPDQTSASRQRCDMQQTSHPTSYISLFTSCWDLPYTMKVIGKWTIRFTHPLPNCSRSIFRTFHPKLFSRQGAWEMDKPIRFTGRTYRYGS